MMLGISMRGTTKTLVQVVLSGVVIGTLLGLFAQYFAMGIVHAVPILLPIVSPYMFMLKMDYILSESTSIFWMAQIIYGIGLAALVSWVWKRFGIQKESKP